jgi:DNA-binding NarL/FixJ family response regulator
MHLQRLRVGFVEDHAATRTAIARVIENYSDRIERVETFASGEAFLESDLCFDAVLVDLGLPGISGSHLIRKLVREAPALKSIAFTVFGDDANVLAALEAGASGFLLKEETPDRLVRAIEEASLGLRPLSSNVTRCLIDRALRFSPRITLSPREEELARALADGSSYVQCSERLGIRLGTVQDYVKNIYRKLDVRSKRELRLWFGNG